MTVETFTSHSVFQPIWSSLERRDLFFELQINKSALTLLEPVRKQGKIQDFKKGSLPCFESNTWHPFP
jgi:hypothetical protein